jgi:hypothetical protein
VLLSSNPNSEHVRVVSARADAVQTTGHGGGMEIAVLNGVSTNLADLVNHHAVLF